MAGSFGASTLALISKLKVVVALKSVMVLLITPNKEIQEPKRDDATEVYHKLTLLLSDDDLPSYAAADIQSLRLVSLRLLSSSIRPLDIS